MSRNVEITEDEHPIVERAHCQDCRWANGNADCRSHAKSHAARFGHRTVVSRLGFVSYAPVAESATVAR